MAKKIAKTLCGLTVVMAAVGGVLAYLKIRDQKDSLDEDEEESEETETSDETAEDEKAPQTAEK